MRAELTLAAKVLTDLANEPWDDYEPTLTRAVTMLVTDARKKLTTALRSISKVTPEETRAEGAGPNAWWADVLDTMR